MGVCDVCGKKTFIPNTTETFTGNNYGVCDNCLKALRSAKEASDKGYLNDIDVHLNKLTDSIQSEDVRFSINAYRDELKLKRNPKQKALAFEEVLLGKALYEVKGARGRLLKVYEDFIAITVEVTLGSVITSNATDGTKIIFYKDCIGLQFKEPGATLGYLQLETASGLMNNEKSNMFNENTFTFELMKPEIKEVIKFIFNKIYNVKLGKDYVKPE